MKLNRYFLLVLIIGVGLILVTRLFFRTAANGIPAVAFAREHRINSEVQSIVFQLLVKPGQQVHAGDTLIRLISNEIIQNTERNKRRLAGLNYERNAKQRVIQTSIDLARSEIKQRISRLLEQKRQAELELVLNRKLSPVVQEKEIVSPLQFKIQDLNDQIVLEEKEIEIKISDIRTRYGADLAVLQTQIDQINAELEILRNQKNRLIKIAAYDGVVEGVFVKQGELLNGFTDLLSVLPASPESIVAYALPYGASVSIGTEVKVQSWGKFSEPVIGKVIGYGSIVPLPEILQKSTAVKAFGKEIFVQIPLTNPFSAGEKVLVKP
jgi:multidrug resistance efflux pump